MDDFVREVRLDGCHGQPRHSGHLVPEVLARERYEDEGVPMESVRREVWQRNVALGRGNNGEKTHCVL